MLPNVVYSYETSYIHFETGLDNKWVTVLSRCFDNRDPHGQKSGPTCCWRNIVPCLDISLEIKFNALRLLCIQKGDPSIHQTGPISLKPLYWSDPNRLYRVGERVYNNFLSWKRKCNSIKLLSNNQVKYSCKKKRNRRKKIRFCCNNCYGMIII